jgi:hypothetical protein
MRNDSVEEILNGVLSNQLFHHVFFMGDMNYRVTFDPATPADIRVRSNSQVPESGEPKRVSDTPVPTEEKQDDDVADPKDVDFRDDEEDEENDFDPEDSTRETHMNIVYQNIQEENWSAMVKTHN